MTRRFAGQTLFPHTCCDQCAICRWFRLGEGMGRTASTGKGAIGERWSTSGEWSKKVAAWKEFGGRVGAVNQDAANVPATPSPFGLGTGPAAPSAVYPNPHN